MNICIRKAHCGSANVGHYTCYVEPTCKSEWKHCNDNVVQNCFEKDAIEGNFGGLEGGANAYLLVYLRNDQLNVLLRKNAAYSPIMIGALYSNLEKHLKFLDIFKFESVKSQRVDKNGFQIIKNVNEKMR